MGVADAVLVCAPEHAGALEGSMDDLLEWTVGPTVMAARPGLGGRAEVDVAAGGPPPSLTSAD